MVTSLTPKKIVLCSDGTGNSSAKSEKTNVWCLYQALDLSGPDQVGAYDDGVGTSKFKYWAIIEGAFGIGLKRNVLDLYKFACRNYPNPNGVARNPDAPQPDIYGFGFSRGAFTIRLLVDFIVTEGLVCYRSEEELERNARAAYRNYRRMAFPAKLRLLTWVGRFIRDLFFWIKDSALGFQPYSVVKAQTKKAGRANIRIKFLGLWDTVEAYGLPVAELKDGVDKFLWPLVFGSLELSPKVDRACHALALDDERQTFHPLLWEEESEDPKKREERNQPPVRRGRITQVWFSGVHSNVGGGYPEDQLSYMSLEWILSEAKEHGLALDMGVFRQYADAKSPFARLYDSRQGLGAYYRYGPRQIRSQKDNQGNDILPIIHGSVITRMVRGTDDYTSVPLPGRFWVLAPDGELLPGDYDENIPALDATKCSPASVPSLVAEPKKIAAEKATLIETIKQLPRSADRQKSVELVLDTIFWCRALYVLTLALTFYLVAFPLIGGAFTTLIVGGFKTAMRYARETIPYIGELWKAPIDANNAIAPSVTAEWPAATVGLIPHWLNLWIERVMEHRVEAILIAAAIVICLRLSSALQLRIHDLARAGWNEEFRNAYASSRKDAKRAVIARAAIWVVVPFVGSFVARLAAAPEWIASALFGASGIAAAFALLFLPRILEDAEKNVVAFEATFAQKIARFLRTCPPLRHGYPVFTKGVVPALFALALVIVSALLFNRIAYTGLSSTNLFCTASGDDAKVVEGPTQAADFSADQMCWPTKLKLEQGKTYRITLTSDGAWFDRSLRTDVIGFPNSRTLIHQLYAPFKRQPDANWFTPIIRVGDWGGEEYALVAGKQAPNNYGQCVENAEFEKTALYFNARITDDSAKRLQSCSPTPSSGLSVSREITPEQSGELFVYVNDAAPMLPFLAGLFTANNRGTATIKVEPLDHTVASSTPPASSPMAR
jgi:uncharacterized protein (DUF2235 family)